ncbi:alpha-hydroxy-acid oxidizing protein [Microbacterium rhizomatis]|uniref:Alpha-hydroxy-acid oxidizing protein n=1 Tax=Microbacterium rhizomatis TaxID=1631477 RepID=A0A5J5IZR7_9MICO|nr:alpha-hydroxy acid oxidase [Microbacterium rhizomatis]KAA9106374.1 alpha-hydroxy-acid oxidizing protein [Microbacterium rhizomatis]
MSVTATADDVREVIEAYIHGGPADGATVRANVEAWEGIALRPRVLRDVTTVDLGIDLFGLRSPVPVIAAPWAGHGLLYPDGEIATARGLRAAGIPLVQSAGSSVALDDVAVHSGPFWQQVYVPDDRTLIDGFLARAVTAGATALVLTVDHPAVGNTLPFRAGLGRILSGDAPPPNFADLPSGSALGTATDLGPTDIGVLAAKTGLPVIVKGVVRADDAQRAVDAGAAAIVVSNHGGRQLAGSITTAGASSRARSPRPPRSPRSSPRSARRCRYSWTAESAAAKTSSGRSRSARTRCSSGVRSPPPSRPTAKTASPDGPARRSKTSDGRSSCAAPPRSHPSASIWSPRLRRRHHDHRR